MAVIKRRDGLTTSRATRMARVKDSPPAAGTTGGLLGRTPTRKVRSLRTASPFKGPAQAVMATRLALEPEASPSQAQAHPQAGSKPVPEARAQVLAPTMPHIDMFLLSTVVCLLMLGTVFIYSASMYQSYAGIGNAATTGNVNYYLTRQISWLFLGTIALLVGLRFNYQKLRRFSMAGLGITAVLLLLVHVRQLQVGVGDNYRWVHLGPLVLQPSEIGKLALTIYAAHWLSSKDDEIKHSLKGLVPFGAVLGLTILMVFKQPDLGTGSIISMSMLAMFFVSGARVRHLLLIAAMFLPLGYFVTHAGNYWHDRIEIWHHPFEDTQGLGYQISRSLLAFWHGGLTGVGLGNGQLKQSLPVPQSDTIFATIGEELGLVGTLSVVGLFAYFGYRGIRISILARDPFGKLLATGITTYLVFQALLNMLSVTNMIPFTGVPLPFISFGGSSLIVNLLAVGVLLNVSRHIELIPEERRDLAGTYLWWRNRRPHLPMPERRSQSRSRTDTNTGWRAGRRVQSD